MSGLSREMRGAVQEILFPALAEVGVGLERADAFLPPRLEDAFRRLEVAFSGVVSPSRTRSSLESVAARVDDHNRQEIRRVLSLDVRREDLGLGTFLDRFVQQNVDLIQSIPQRALGEVEGIVRSAHAGQIRVEALRDQIMARFDVSESRAALIARDQTLKANGQLNQLRQQAVGVREYEWIASRDERVREDHAALDGQRFSWLEPPIVDERTGRREHPGGDYQCRCTASPVLDGLLDSSPAAPVEGAGTFRAPPVQVRPVPLRETVVSPGFGFGPATAPAVESFAPQAPATLTGRLEQPVSPVSAVQEIRSRLGALRDEDGPLPVIQVQQATEVASTEIREGVEAWQEAWKHDSSRAAELADAGLAVVGAAPATVSEAAAEAARYLYAATQEALTNRGITSRVLYRGVGGAQAQEIRAAVEAARAAGQTHVNVRVRPLASWSRDPDVARDFADQPTGAKSVEVSRGTGVVIRSDVHRSRVFAAHDVDEGMSHGAAEREWVVLHPDGYASIPIEDIEFR